jgi:RHS repeat-associated protein
MKTANSALHLETSFLLLFLPIILAVAPDHLAAQSCGPCVSGDEVEIEFSASAHGGFLYDSSNLSVNLNNVTTSSASPTTTSLGTVGLRIGETYVCTVNCDADKEGNQGYCHAGVIANFKMMANECGKTMRVSVEEPKYQNGWIYEYSGWTEASSVVAAGLVNDPEGDGHGTALMRIKIQILEKSSDNGLSGANTFASTTQTSTYLTRSIASGSQDQPPGTDGQPLAVTPSGFSSSLSLGSTTDSSGYDTGVLTLSGPLSPALADPANLRLSNPGVSELSTVMNGQTIQQVANAERAVDVQSIGGGGFEVRFFEAGSYGPTLDPSDIPYGTVSYTPLQAQGDHLGGVRVTSSGDDQVARIRDMVSTNGNGESWRITESAGGVVQEIQNCTSWFDYVNGKWERTDMVETTRDGALYSKTVSRYLYQTRREGTPSQVVQSNLFLLEETVYHSATGFTTTTWEPDPNQLGRVKSVLRPDGSWEVYEYYTGNEMSAYPSWAGLLMRTLKPWNGQPADPSSATVANSESTLIVYDDPSTTVGTGRGPETTRRTTYAPGGSVIMKDWAKTAPSVTVNDLNSVLQAAGVAQAWLPTAASIRTGHATEYASGDFEVSTTSLTYENPHVPDSPWVGSSYGYLDAEGNGAITGYERGTMNAGVFTPNDPEGAQENWGSDIRTTAVTVSNFGTTLYLEATREVTIRDFRGYVYLTTLSILDDSGTWSEATTTSYEYPASSIGADGVPKEVIVRQDGRIISHRNEIVAGDTIQTTQWNEEGIETVTIRDLMGRILSETKAGVAAGTGYDAQPDIVTNHTYDGHITTTTILSGNLTRSEFTVEDLAGRIVSRTDQTGAETSLSYPNGGRDTLTTLPGGLTRLETRNIDGRIASITGTAVVDEHYAYDISTVSGSSGNIITTKRVGDLVNSPRFTITEQDWLGRTVNVTTPSPTGAAGESVSTISSYASGTNRMAMTTSPAGAILFSKPYPESNRTYTGQDADGDEALLAYTSDRVTESLQNYSYEDGYWWQVSTTRSFDLVDSDESALTTITKRCLHGSPGGNAAITESVSPSGLVSTITTVIDRENKMVTRTEQTNASTIDAVSISANGLLVSQSGHDTPTPTRWSHNPLGEPIKQTSPLGEISRMDYYPNGLLKSTTDQAGKLTGYQYYGPTHPSAGKLSVLTNPSQRTITYAYSSLGQVTEEAGTATYKVTYEYDEFGARKKMFTWRDATTADRTEWVCQPGTGLLERKKDAKDKATVYTYYPSGKMETRTWARTPAVTTTYTYNDLGDLDGIDYSDSTPDVTFSDASHPHDRLGRPTIIIQNGVGSETLTYHPGGESMDTRLYSSGHSLLPDISIGYSAPDAPGRPTGFTTYASGFIQNDVDYGYDTTGRLETVSDGPHENRSFVYTYRPDSSLVATLTSKLDGSAWFRENRYQDVRGRPIGIRSARVSGASVVAKISSHGYDYDALGRRTKNTFQDGSRWEYGYNDRSEVTSAVRKNAAGNSIPQLGASYGYDGIGNRLSSNSPVMGDHIYTPNSLNQYETITTANTRTAIGRADTSWNILVNNTAADRNGDIYFRALTADNASAPVWQEVITKRNTGTPTNTGHLWYAAASVSPAYDFDGNLTNDGRWIYSWDAENRLVQMETTTEATTAGHPYVKVRYAYDWQGRRLARTVYKGTAATPVFSESQRWLYDGWNPVIEFTSTAATGGTLTRCNTYSWGLDLSGTLQGAGGVGGLLGLARLTIDPGTYLATTDLYAPSYDGNGNIVAWTKSTNSAPTSRREYDAFGNTVVTEGTAPCGFGFSTKMQDAETGLCYYGHRFYNPLTGRWISKDPIQEQGGNNLYSYVRNDGVLRWDVLGLAFGFGPGEFPGPAPSSPGWPANWTPGFAPGEFPGPAPDITVTIGWLGDFVGGTSNTTRIYSSGSRESTAIRSGFLGQQVRSRIRKESVDYCCSKTKRSLPFLTGLGRGIREIPESYYPSVFLNWVVTDPITAYTGSFTNGTITFKYIDCKSRKVRASIHAVNESSAESLTRLPPSWGGYKGRGPIIDGSWKPKWPASSILPSTPPGLTNYPLNTISQIYDWDEDINF